MIRSTPEFDQRIADWLEADPATAPADVLSTVTAALPSIPQARRGLLAPWRFTQMTNVARAAAGIAIVAIVGVGILAFNSRGGVGAQTPAPPTASPAPTPGGPGISSFTTYTSAVYGITFGYPDGWRLLAAAERKVQPGDPPGYLLQGPYTDIFGNPKDRDGGEIVFNVWQQAAGSGADITSRKGLAAWAAANWCDDASEACETVPNVALPMCLGRAACLAAVVVPLTENIGAFFKDSKTGLVTIVMLARHDTFPATTRYGGGVQLLKSILTTMDVWTPGPGQIP